MTRTWEQLSKLEQMASTYSDFHKDAYGFRPRGDVSGWTVEDFEKEFERLGRVCQANDEEREEAEKHAAVQFEALVSNLIGRGAKDRETAIRWLAEAEGTGDDRQHLCYCMGLPYNYFA